jgi:hypothetical protein
MTQGFIRGENSEPVSPASRYFRKGYFTIKIGYQYSYVSKGAFFEGYIIFILKCVLTMLCRVHKRPQTSDVVATHKLLRDQIAIDQGVCVADKFVLLEFVGITRMTAKFA